MSKVLIYCSASNSLSPIFYSEMRLLGQELASAKHELIFGGGCDGLMGAVVDEHHKGGGHAIGVVPTYFNDPDIVYSELDELIVTNDLMERKKKMLELCDVVVASPGGLGTFDEITEAIAVKQLGEMDKPIILHNHMDYWETYIQGMIEMKQRHMIQEKLSDLYTVCKDYKEVISVINSQK